MSTSSHDQILDSAKSHSKPHSPWQLSAICQAKGNNSRARVTLKADNFHKCTTFTPLELLLLRISAARSPNGMNFLSAWGSASYDRSALSFASRSLRRGLSPFCFEAHLGEQSREAFQGWQSRAHQASPEAWQGKAHGMCTQHASDSLWL